MLEKWLKKEERPSWDQIVAALEDMSEKSLASELKKYLQQPENASTTLAKPTPLVPETVVIKVDRRDSVATELESLKENHLRLVQSAESALEAVSPSRRKLKRFSQSYLTNRVVSTVEELFDCLDDFCFLDYALLQYIINHFLNEAQSVVTSLGNYIQQLNNFKRSTTLKEFMDNIQNAHKSKHGTGMRTVTIRLIGGWLEKTMKDLDRLLKEIFEDKSSILAHLNIIRGSVIVTYLVPRSEVQFLVNLAQAKPVFMSRVGVCSLRIDNFKFHDPDQAENFLFKHSLFEAIRIDDINLVTFLLDINTNPDAAISEERYSALIYGIILNRKETVRLLLKANANPNYQAEDGLTPLYYAAQEGHSILVELLLQANVNINFQMNNGGTPLSIATQKGHADTVAILLQANANPNTQRNDGSTCLHTAAYQGHADIVAILLRANANPNIQRNDGSTCLHMAADQGHTDIVAILLQANASPNIQQNDGFTPLYMAACEGLANIVDMLLEAKANPYSPANNGKTPLYMAAQEGHSDIVDIFIQANVDPDRHGNVTPLCIAAQLGYVDIVDILLKGKADPNVLSVSDATPLFMASQQGYSHIVHMLLRAYANPNIQTSDQLVTPLHQAAQNGHVDIVSILLRANANPNRQKLDGTTPLYIAAQKGHFDILDLLLQANADPSLKCVDGSTPLFIAAQNGHADIVSILLRAKSNPNIRIEITDSTPLYIATQNEHCDIVRILLQANANPNIQGDGGTTPLYIASQKGFSDIVQLLLEAKADPNFHLENGSTPVMCASLNSFSQILQLLLKNGADPNKKAKLQSSCTGTTALMCASYSGCLECTKLLLNFGADPSTVDSQGKTALDMAVSSGHVGIADLIRAVQHSQSTTTSPVSPATTGISPSIDNKTMESILVAKVESIISTEYEKKVDKTLLPKEPIIFS